MKLHRLQLFDYRNFERLDLEFTSDVTVFIGNNAQGKSNLLEAVYLLATMRAVRAETDVQLICRETISDVQPAARIVGYAESGGQQLKIEVAVVAHQGANNLIAKKTVKLNGAPKRIGAAIGRVTAVLFTADDLDMVTGSPALRRRFVNIALSQVDREYSADLRRYEQVLPQRNRLLKRIREGQAAIAELEFWDDELVKHGGRILHRRATALEKLALLAEEAHASLASQETLAVRYKPRLDGFGLDVSDGVDCAVEAITQALRAGQRRDVAAGMTLSGPHRDDIELILNGDSASGYASRAQQRTIALAVRLAEARFLFDERAEVPLLLLDDILSEMDAGRRESVLAALSDMGQMLITGTDRDRFPADFAGSAQLSKVVAGTLQSLT